MVRKKRLRLSPMVEPPASATGDIAFNLIVFFLVCASVQPDSGREQSLPRSDQDSEEQTENIQVQLTRNAVMLNGAILRQDDFAIALNRSLKGKVRPEDRVVIVQSKPDTPYSHWVIVTEMIDQAGGIVTIQTEEVQQMVVPNS
ncbi:MAG: biopolymer transporter ExbD [Planctomycetaceae bacterium]|nr:biopolymer transporter ExbD [Planctomycetaceae bacterium]MBT4013278.1 biopolymer transporter ExbD [Planctomycetaceae bacterium]MBT4846500.1 biopolymer transporter ExbD [Planctomycetaceae bacterium]MBT5123436.1 biopolymer transporter ExbD [Planctomycetaceae bacterium]MBT5600173.1 biopolymer transporter ExbD [Planctomycetaceae bacterium]